MERVKKSAEAGDVDDTWWMTDTERLVLGCDWFVSQAALRARCKMTLHDLLRMQRRADDSFSIAVVLAPDVDTWDEQFRRWLVRDDVQARLTVAARVAGQLLVHQIEEFYGIPHEPATLRAAP